MNLILIRPKNQIEELLLSVSKNCELLIQQTHRKPDQEKHSISIHIFPLKVLG